MATPRATKKHTFSLLLLMGDRPINRMRSGAGLTPPTSDNCRPSRQYSSQAACKFKRAVMQSAGLYVTLAIDLRARSSQLTCSELTCERQGSSGWSDGLMSRPPIGVLAARLPKWASRSVCNIRFCDGTTGAAFSVVGSPWASRPPTSKRERVHLLLSVAAAA